jgi:hypothetical protein
LQAQVWYLNNQLTAMSAAIAAAQAAQSNTHAIAAPSPSAPARGKKRRSDTTLTTESATKKSRKKAKASSDAPPQSSVAAQVHGVGPIVSPIPIIPSTLGPFQPSTNSLPPSLQPAISRTPIEGYASLRPSTSTVATDVWFHVRAVVDPFPPDDTFPAIPISKRMKTKPDGKAFPFVSCLFCECVHCPLHLFAQLIYNPEIMVVGNHFPMSMVLSILFGVIVAHSMKCCIWKMLTSTT